MAQNWNTFESATLSQAVKDVIMELGFKCMTPIQAAAIPKLLARKDVSAEAVTGSGKTLAFIIPLIEILQRRQNDTPWTSKEIGAIVISPTRELALQIAEVLGNFLNHKDLQYLKQRLVVGGNNIEEEISTLQKEAPCILICTPGRLNDLLERKCNLNLPSRVKSLEFLVLDEADRLLDLGFKSTINNILGYLPRQRRTGLFSATQTKELTDLIRAGLRNPVIIQVKEDPSINTPVRLQNFYKIVEPEEKFIALLQFLQSPKAINGKVMVFLPTCACVEYWSVILTHFLPKRCILSIHGKMRNKRCKAVERFRSEPEAILLCTDVLARGLDIPEIGWVIQWDPPVCASSFVHRVGRTARQGNVGEALVFLLPSEDAYITFIKINQNVELLELQDVAHSGEILQLTLKKLHMLQLADRGVYDKAVRAFVSHIRAYTKHECNAILRVKDLDLGKVATSYGVLQMPKMPELKNRETSSFQGPNFKVDITKLKFKNAQKEQKRQNNLTILEETGEWPRKKRTQKNSEAWEKTKKFKFDSKIKRKLRKEKKQLKKESEDTRGRPSSERKKRRFQYTQEDLQELANDIRLFKKLKRNKISDEDFCLEMGIECH